MSEAFKTGFRSLAAAAATALRKVDGETAPMTPIRYALKAKADSEIERQMADALVGNHRLTCGALPIIVLEGDLPSEGFAIAPQRWLESIRPDFTLSWNGKRLLVECDGHEFHDKNPASAAYDKWRDRFCLIRGWPVMRFTGAEITRNPDICANEVADYLTGDGQ